MNKKKKVTAFALNTAVALGLAATPAWSATSNPFQMQSLENGYLVAQAEPKVKGVEIKSQEGHCGSMKDKNKEGHCGGAMSSENKFQSQGGEKKTTEAKCGEGTCGGSTKKNPM
jgi:uncharacterized low-complexity protein